MTNQRIHWLGTITGAMGLMLAIGCGSDDMPIDQEPDAGASAPDSGPGNPAVGVRRSWTSLTPEERKQFIDGIILLKQKTQLSWDYTSRCEGQEGEYTKNAYDYFVELHLDAFTGMMMPGMFDHHNRPHMGPHFLPWHREMLMRFEQELRDVLNDPDFMLPYWDWSAPVEEVFSTADMGDVGACPAALGDDFGDVAGYIEQQGYQANIYDAPSAEDPMMNTITCAPKKLTRGPGCFAAFAPTLPTAEDVARALEIPTYDLAPYNNLDVEEQESFRQYLEGFTNEDKDEPTGFCKMAGCRMHGQVHIWLGGLMGSGAAPNDPIFFLHHANVDRIWAEWQAKYGDSTYPSTGAHDYTGALFMFQDAEGNPVTAAQQFDHRALGYIYDTQQ